MLKRDLRISPEERYQSEKRNWFFHDLSYLHQTVDENGKALDIIKESGCGHWSNKREEGCCVPECRYYLKYGRIEDDEVIQEHNEMVKQHIQENTIVEPPDLDSEEALVFFQRRPWAFMLVWFRNLTAPERKKGNGPQYSSPQLFRNRLMGTMW